MGRFPVWLGLSLFLVSSGSLSQPVANLSLSSFGHDDYTKMLSSLLVADDWKSVIGQNIYRNLIIHNREFSSIYHGLAFPDVPAEPDIKVSSSGTTGFTSFDVSGSAQMFLCIDGYLLSRCSYMTKLNVDSNFVGPANSVFALVARNHAYSTLLDWFTSGYNRSGTASFSPDDDLLLTPTGIIDVIGKDSVATQTSSETDYDTFTNAGLPMCSTWSNFTYASSDAQDGFYPISPKCYTYKDPEQQNVTRVYMLAYAQPTSDTSQYARPCKNVSWALYEDPGYIIGGPIVLDIFNVWQDLSVAIGGITTVPWTTVIDFMPKSVQIALHDLSFAIVDSASQMSYATYAEAQQGVSDIITDQLTLYYQRYNISDDITEGYYFRRGPLQTLFVHTSTNAARYLLQDPYVKLDSTSAPNLLGSTLGDQVPEFVRTKKYCLASNFSVNVSMDMIQPLTDFMQGFHLDGAHHDLKVGWSNKLGTMMTGWAVAAAAPVVFASRRTGVFSYVLVGVVAASVIVLPSKDYYDFTKSSIATPNDATLVSTTVAPDGSVVVSLIRTHSAVSLRKRLEITGWVLAGVTFLFVLFLNNVVAYYTRKDAQPAVDTSSHAPPVVVPAPHAQPAAPAPVSAHQLPRVNVLQRAHSWAESAVDLVNPPRPRRSTAQQATGKNAAGYPVSPLVATSRGALGIKLGGNLKEGLLDGHSRSDVHEDDNPKDTSNGASGSASV